MDPSHIVDSSDSKILAPSSTLDHVSLAVDTKKSADILEQDLNVADCIPEDAIKNPDSFYNLQNMESIIKSHKVLISTLVGIQSQILARRKEYQIETRKRSQVEERYRDLQLEVTSYEKELSQEIETRQKIEKQCEQVNKKLGTLLELLESFADSQLDPTDSLKKLVENSNNVEAQASITRLIAAQSALMHWESRFTIHSGGTSKSGSKANLLNEKSETEISLEYAKPPENQESREVVVTSEQQTAVPNTAIFHAGPTTDEKQPTSSTTVSSSSQQTAKQGAISHCIPHRFEIHKVFAPVRCQLCKTMIWSGSKVHRCIYCKYNAHTQCHSNVPPNCGMKDLEILKMSMGMPSMAQATAKTSVASNSKKPLDSSKNHLLGSSTSSNNNTSPLHTVFGTPLENLAQSEKVLVPFIVDACLQGVEEFGLLEQGIYRVPGKKAEIERLKMHFNYGRPNLKMEAKNDVSVVAGVIKLFLRELPDPLIPFEVQKTILTTADDGKIGKREKDEIYKQSLQKLSEVHYAVLKRLIYHFVKVESHSNVNKMMASNLAVVFGPTIIRPKDDADLFYMTHQISIVENWIKKYHYFFENGPYGEDASRASSPVLNDKLKIALGKVAEIQSSSSPSNFLSSQQNAATESTATLSLIDKIASQNQNQATDDVSLSLNSEKATFIAENAVTPTAINNEGEEEAEKQYK